MGALKLHATYDEAEWLSIVTGNTKAIYYDVGNRTLFYFFHVLAEKEPMPEPMPYVSFIAHKVNPQGHSIAEIAIKGITIEMVNLPANTVQPARKEKRIVVHLGKLVPLEESIDPWLDHKGLRLEEKPKSSKGPFKFINTIGHKLSTAFGRGKSSPFR